MQSHRQYQSTLTFTLIQLQQLINQTNVPTENVHVSTTQNQITRSTNTHMQSTVRYKLHVYRHLAICEPLWQNRNIQPLGRSRDNWRKDHLKVILSIYCFWFLFFNIVGRLLCHSLTVHTPFRPIKWHSRDFTLALCTVLKLFVKLKALDCTFCRYQ